MKALAATLLALTLACGVAESATPYELYAQGKFDDAVAAGRASNSAQGFTMASRAELASAAMDEKPCLDCIERAEADARAAIALNPSYAEAHVYLAGALGYEGRIIGNVEAQLRGYPGTAKQELDAAIANDPKDAKAYAARGGWNIEIVHAGGTLMARTMFGARLEKGLADFHKAFTLSPDDPAIRYQYALVLSGFDPVAYHNDIDNALTKTQTLRARTVYEAFVQRRAKELQAAMRNGDADTIAALVRKFQGYP